MDRNFYKTKLCLLYQRGRCSRQYCNFAHGSAELRRSFNGRQENMGGGDLRVRLDRIRSPSHKSPVRGDPEPRHSFRVGSSRSHGKRIERNHRKRKQLDGHSGYSDRMSDFDEDQAKGGRRSSSDAKIRTDEKLREIQSEIKNLESDKRQLEMYLEDKVKEADMLTSKIHEQEMQLSKEKEETKRLTANIKKFIKAHNRHLQLQDELKRSHAELQRLGEQLESDAVGLGIEDDSRVNTINDGISGFSSPLDEGQASGSPQRKRSRLLMEDHGPPNQVNGRNRVEKLSRQSVHHNLLGNSKKPEAEVGGYNAIGLSAYEDRSRRGTKQPADIVGSADKYKATETTLPSTGIAAHAMHEDAEVLYGYDKFQLPPLPPNLPNVDLQHKGEDENVDIDGLDEALDTVGYINLTA